MFYHNDQTGVLHIRMHAGGGAGADRTSMIDVPATEEHKAQYSDAYAEYRAKIRAAEVAAQEEAKAAGAVAELRNENSGLRTQLEELRATLAEYEAKLAAVQLPQSPESPPAPPAA